MQRSRKLEKNIKIIIIIILLLLLLLLLILLYLLRENNYFVLANTVNGSGMEIWNRSDTLLRVHVIYV